LTTEPRIVCFVPSITEMLFDLRLGDRVVGRTGFCIHPWEAVRHVPKVGGTKDIMMDRVRALAPTHAIVNVDENRREDAEALRAFVPEVIVTHPCAPRDNVDLYRQMGAIFDRDEEAEALCARFEEAYAAATAVERPRREVLYLIWRDPWMGVAPDTYISRTLAAFNWHTVPAAPDVRYPQLRLEDHAGAVDHVLLSSEPYHFKDHHIAEVAAAVPGARVALVDGEMTSWYGSRAIAGLTYLANFVGGAA
jgi:ABC-type Fe3+-hydroxamate transport system substrate-binding protein